MENLYLIRRPAHPGELGQEVWWKKDRKGYASCIHEAGVYTQEDVDSITAVTERDRADPVPVTQQILQQVAESARKARETAEWRFNTAKTDYESELNRITAAEMRFDEVRKKVNGNG